MKVAPVEIKNEVEIIKDFENFSLSQIVTNLKFVILDNNYKTLHIPWCCKDYFNELITTELDSKERRIYGYTSKKLEFDLLNQKTFKLGLIINAKFKLNNYDLKLLSILNLIEKNRGFELSTIEYTNNDNELILNSDIRWLSLNPVYMSFYFIMVRLSYSYTLENSIDDFLNKDLKDNLKLATNDYFSYLQHLNFLKYLIEGGIIDDKWDSYLNLMISGLHSSSGLISYDRKNKTELEKKINNFNNEKENNKI